MKKIAKGYDQVFYKTCASCDHEFHQETVVTHTNTITHEVQHYCHPCWNIIYPELRLKGDQKKETAGYGHILRECADIADERQGQYGSPQENFEDIQKICKTAFGLELSLKAIANVMVAVKLSRQKHKRKKDNMLDAINYLAISEVLEEPGMDKKASASDYYHDHGLPGHD